MQTASRWEMRLAIAALIAAVLASVAWVLLPVYSSGNSISHYDGNWIYWLLLVPPAFAALPVLPFKNRHRAVVASAWLVGLFSFLTGFTIGIMYWPSALLMIIAAYVGRIARPDRGDGPKRSAAETASARNAVINVLRVPK